MPERPPWRHDAVAQTQRARVELLLQDVNHRVGNNLAMVSGMLGLQIAATQDEAVRGQLKAAQARVSTIANARAGCASAPTCRRGTPTIEAGSRDGTRVEIALPKLETRPA